MRYSSTCPINQLLPEYLYIHLKSFAKRTAHKCRQYFIIFYRNGWDQPSDFSITIGEHHLNQDSGREVSRNIQKIIKVLTGAYSIPHTPRFIRGWWLESRLVYGWIIQLLQYFTSFQAGYIMHFCPSLGLTK